MNQFIFLLAMIGICNAACIETNTTAFASMYVNATYSLQPDTCLHFTDTNITIDWVAKTYGISTTITNSTPYINTEADIAIYSMNCPTCEVCQSRNWTEIDILSGESFLDTYSETFYNCEEGVIIPSNYCYQNYWHTANINTTQTYNYLNPTTNISININFQVPTCPTIDYSNCTNITNVENVTNVTQNCSLPMKTTNVYCGQTSTDSDRNVTFVGPSCSGALNQVLNLECPSSYVFGSPTNLTINVADKTCPVCATCATCEVCTNSICYAKTSNECNCSSNGITSFNVEELLQWNGENCTSFSSVCRDYFYQLPCSIEEADAGNLSGCVGRVYTEKDNTIATCESSKTELNKQISDITGQLDEKKRNDDFILMAIGGLILLFCVPLTIAVVLWYAQKNKVIGQEKKTPNPELPNKLKGEKDG